MTKQPLTQWPKGLDLPVATISFSPEEIERRAGIQFDESSDDLGRFKGCLIKVGDWLFVLQRHLDSPSRGTDVLIRGVERDKRAALLQLLRELQLVESDLTWLHPSVGGTLRRAVVDVILSRLREDSPRIQFLYGPRQVGKTTATKQILSEWNGPTHYASADPLESHRGEWLMEQWQTAKSKGGRCLLAIDEFQKIPDWDSHVKALWDSREKNSGLRLILLGSTSPKLKLHRKETLAGRFEEVYVPHWSLPEFRTIQNCELDQFLIFGGYPGAIPFTSDFERWLSYIRDSIFGPSVGDVIESRPMKNVDEFKRFFSLLGEEGDISYRSLRDRLQSHGNTDTIKRFIGFYEQVYLVKSISKYKGASSRLSSPKVLPRCAALHTYGAKRKEIRDDAEWAQLFAMVVGQDLVRAKSEITYWREGNRSVDYVLEHEGKTYGIEIKKPGKAMYSGISAFKKLYPKAKVVTLSADAYEPWSRDPLGYLRVAAT